jgi:isoquinoline 1-oxidoreductase beta subunit
MKNTLPTSRRGFLCATAGVSGSFALGIELGGAQALQAAENANKRINIWVEIAPDDTVDIKFARSEMGQGSLTSAPQLVADELDASWEQVRISYVDANEHMRRNRAWGDMATVGSRTIRNSQDYLRTAGATAKAMLLTAASQKWSVPLSELTVNQGIISHEASNRRTGFGSLAALAATLAIPEEVSLKDPSGWHIIGKSVPRIDIPASVDGSQVYGIDIELPDMLHASIAQSPVFGGKVRTFDAEKAKGRRGILEVFTIDEGKALVVVADNWWRAKQALQEVVIEWDNQGNDSIGDAELIAQFTMALSAPEAAALPNNRGDAETALASSKTVLEADYYTPFLSHSPMEPMGATVQIANDRVDIWCSTQNAEGCLVAVANALQRDVTDVYLHRVQAGGGFGRRGGGDEYAAQAALIAAHLRTQRPVKLLWTREEDMQHDFYRPLGMYRLKAGLNEEGKITGWEARIASGSILNQMRGVPLARGVDGPATEGFLHLPYEIADQKQSYKQVNTHVPLGFWRTVGWSQTPFAREQFIDELALAAGKDPLAFRLEHMPEDELSRHILEVAAEAANWSSKPVQGVYRGIATTEPYGSYTAAVVELSVDDSGAIKVHRIIQAINCGHAVNPLNIEAQLQGATVWTLTAAMWGEINISEGRVMQSNFHDYRMLRLAEMPHVEVVIANTGGFWGGVGEPGQAPLLPAFCNALYAATGKRIRKLPLHHYGYRFA